MPLNDLSANSGHWVPHEKWNHVDRRSTSTRTLSIAQQESPWGLSSFSISTDELASPMTPVSLVMPHPSITRNRVASSIVAKILRYSSQVFTSYRILLDTSISTWRTLRSREIASPWYIAQRWRPTCTTHSCTSETTPLFAIAYTRKPIAISLAVTVYRTLQLVQPCQVGAQGINLVL